jgi:hypothetical protein
VAVSGAQISLQRREDGGKPTPLGSGNTDAQGRFRIGTVAHGPCLLVAEKKQVGLAELALDLPERGVSDVGVLVLEGSGEIAGQVVFPGGRPVADENLRATLVGEPTSSGLRQGSLRTDETGHFHFRGLAGGEYRLEHLYARYDPRIGFGEQGLTRTGTHGLLLVLPVGRLSVRAEDRLGRPLVIHRIRISNRDANRPLYSMSHGGASSGPEILLPHGHRYLVEADTEGTSVLGEEVELAAGEEGREVVLRPPSPETSAALLLEVRGPDGSSVTRYKVKLSRDAAHPKWLHAPDELEEGAFRGLEPGTYRLGLDVSMRPAWESDLYTLEVPSRVELVAGEVTIVPASVASGGRVELDLSSVPALQERHMARLHVHEPGTPQVAADDVVGLDALYVLAKKPGVYRRMGGDFLYAPHPLLGYVWTTEDPLPPGRWMLRLYAKGYRTWEQEVDVRGGETTRVSVTLERE